MPGTTRVSPVNGISFRPTALAGCTSVTYMWVTIFYNRTCSDLGLVPLCP